MISEEEKIIIAKFRKYGTKDGYRAVLCENELNLRVVMCGINAGFKNKWDVYATLMDIYLDSNTEDNAITFLEEIDSYTNEQLIDLFTLRKMEEKI